MARFVRRCCDCGPVADWHLQPEAEGKLRWQHDLQAGAASKEGRPKVRTILVSSALLLTVTSSVGLGVVSAYAAIQGILHTFARQTRQTEEAAPTLIAQEVASQQ